MESKLVDGAGKPIEKNTIPVVSWKGFTLPIRILTNDKLVPQKDSVHPGEIINEMRSGYLEMQDRFTLLSVGLAVLAKKDPGGELDQYLSQVGLVLKDFKNQIIYEPNPDLMEKVAAH